MELYIKLFICLFIMSSLQACAISHHYGPFTGKVIDAKTEKPIEGAAVHIQFSTKTPNPGGIISHYAGATECLTDENGEFNLSYRAYSFTILGLWQEQVNINIFKPEYGAFPGNHKTSITPRPDRCCIEEGVYGVIRLPKLKTIKERRRNMGRMLLHSVPLEDMEIIRNLINQERINTGLKL